MPPGCSPQSLTSVLPPHSGFILFMHLLAYCLRSHMHTMYTLTHCTHHKHTIHIRYSHYIPHTHIIYTPYTLTHTLYTHHIPTHTRAGGSVRVGSSAHLMHWCSLHAESSSWTKWCRQGAGEWRHPSPAAGTWGLQPRAPRSDPGSVISSARLEAPSALLRRPGCT